MTYEQTKSTLEQMMNENYRDFIKALISLEKGIDDLDVLDRVFLDYIREDDVPLLNDEFDKYVNEEVMKKYKEEKSLSL